MLGAMGSFVCTPIICIIIGIAFLINYYLLKFVSYLVSVRKQA